MLGYKPLIIDAVAQLVSHIISASVIILPILLMDDMQTAVFVTIGLTLLLLFIIGVLKARFVKNDEWHDGLEMVILGALVITVGLISGWILR